MKEISEAMDIKRMDQYGIPDVVISYLKSNLPENIISLNDFIRDMERRIISKALKVCNGNRKNTALILGLKYSTLVEKIKNMDIKVEKKIFFDQIYLEN